MKTTHSIVLSLGGSMIVPEKIDVAFLKKFRSLILGFINKNNKNSKIAIICGGGKVCRDYQNAARELDVNDKEPLDLIGIKSTKLNAELVKSIFGEEAFGVVDDPEKPFKTPKRIIIGAGYLPGHSTDTDAILLAKNIGADTIINLTNIDYVYDKDPRKYKDATPLKNLSWNHFLNLIGAEWTPGKNTPFDPVAAKESKNFGMKVIIINGSDLENLSNCMYGRKFNGTIIG